MAIPISVLDGILYGIMFIPTSSTELYEQTVYM